MAEVESAEEVEEGRDVPSLYNVTTSTLAEMSEKAQEVDFTTPEGYKQGVKSLAQCRTLRVQVDKRRKELGAEARAKLKHINDAGNQVIGAIKEIEELLKPKKLEVDQEKEVAREVKRKAEQERVDSIRKRIDSIAEVPFTTTPESTVSELKGIISDIQSVVIDESFQELLHDAERTKQQTLTRLETTLQARERFEAQQAALEAQKKEMEEARVALEAEAREKAEIQKEADRIEDEKRAAKEKVAQEKLAQEKAVQDAKMEKERVEQQAERERMEAEQAKFNAEKAKLEAEKKAIADAEHKKKVEADAKAKAEQEARDKLALEKRQEEERVQAEKAEAERKNALKPDREKIADFFDKVSTTMSSPIKLDNKETKKFLYDFLEEHGKVFGEFERRLADEF
jgi:hypothetical protein